MAKDLELLTRKTVKDIIERQTKFPKALLFSFIMLFLFTLSTFFVKPNFQLFYTFEEEHEDESDFGGSIGNTAIILLMISVVPFVIWSYFREIIQYGIRWALSQLKVIESERFQNIDIPKATKTNYFTIRIILFNIHCIGCLLSCGIVIIHTIGLFNSHNGISFLLPWVAMLSGIYLSISGALLRFRWKTHLQIVRKTSRAIHMQIIITLISVMLIIIHVSLID